MADKKILLTKEGLEQYEREREELQSRLSIDVAVKLKEAREQGDLSENAEYDAAKEEQAAIKTRTDEIDRILTSAEIVEAIGDASTVGVGCMIRIKDLEDDSEEQYSLVGSTEANTLEGKISNESPLGNALIGHKVGDIVDVTVPSGEVLQYEVLSIDVVKSDDKV